MKKVRGLSSSIWVLCILTFSIASGAGVRLPSAPAGQEASPMNMEAIGPRVGAAVPEFTLPDKDGRPRTLRSLLGPQGMMLVFSRSADW